MSYGSVCPVDYWVSPGSMATYPKTICAQKAVRLPGIEPCRIKQLVYNRRLFTIPLPEGRRVISQEIFARAADGWEPLSSLPGALTLLADGGSTEDEATAWFYTEHGELGETPMEMMLAGRHHRMSAIASTLVL